MLSNVIVEDTKRQLCIIQLFFVVLYTCMFTSDNVVSCIILYPCAEYDMCQCSQALLSYISLNIPIVLVVV